MGEEAEATPAVENCVLQETKRDGNTNNTGRGFQSRHGSSGCGSPCLLLLQLMLLLQLEIGRAAYVAYVEVIIASLSEPAALLETDDHCWGCARRTCSGNGGYSGSTQQQNMTVVFSQPRRNKRTFVPVNHRPEEAKCRSLRYCKCPRDVRQAWRSHRLRTVPPRRAACDLLPPGVGSKGVRDCKAVGGGGA